MTTYWQTAVVRIHGASGAWEFQSFLRRPIAPVDTKAMETPWVRCQDGDKTITWSWDGTVTIATDTYTAFLYEKPTRADAILRPDTGVNRGFGDIRYWDFKPDGAVYARNWDGWAMYWGPEEEGEAEKGVLTSYCGTCKRECGLVERCDEPSGGGTSASGEN